MAQGSVGAEAVGEPRRVLKERIHLAHAGTISQPIGHA